MTGFKVHAHGNLTSRVLSFSLWARGSLRTLDLPEASRIRAQSHWYLTFSALLAETSHIKNNRKKKCSCEMTIETYRDLEDIMRWKATSRACHHLNLPTNKISSDPKFLLTQTIYLLSMAGCVINPNQGKQNKQKPKKVCMQGVIPDYGREYQITGSWTS